MTNEVERVVMRHWKQDQGDITLKACDRLISIEQCNDGGFEDNMTDDLESNIFWKCMGWVCIAQRFGISHKNTWKQTSKRVINIYRFDKSDMLLGLGHNPAISGSPLGLSSAKARA